ncbi:hypothetical protein DFH27DRAFT_209996 [Peziza echinospora]|nr:hypothetical protein DFH27DRAFT_209996 [Peziza echinospora]
MLVVMGGEATTAVFCCCCCGCGCCCSCRCRPKVPGKEGRKGEGGSWLVVRTVDEWTQARIWGGRWCGSSEAIHEGFYRQSKHNSYVGIPFTHFATHRAHIPLPGHYSFTIAARGKRPAARQRNVRRVHNWGGWALGVGSSLACRSSRQGREGIGAFRAEGGGGPVIGGVGRAGSRKHGRRQLD